MGDGVLRGWPRVFGVDAGGGGNKIMAGCRGLLATVGVTRNLAGSWVTGFVGCLCVLFSGAGGNLLLGGLCLLDESRGLFPLVLFLDGVTVVVCCWLRWFLWWCSFLSCVIRLRIIPLLCVTPCLLVISCLCYSLAYNTCFFLLA
jgi:hypothetical protein